MGIVTDAEITATGLQIRSWNIEATEAIATVLRNKTSLNAQLENMRLNTIDFTADDVIEMESLIAELEVKIQAL